MMILFHQVYRSLLAIKFRALSSSVSCISAVVLVEVVSNRTHVGVAPVVLNRTLLQCFQAAEETAGISMFAQLAQSAPTLPDSCAAAEWALEHILGNNLLKVCGAVHLFASREELPSQQTDHSMFVPISATASLATLETVYDGDVDVLIKMFGSPVAWAQSVEVVRMPLLAAALANYTVKRYMTNMSNYSVQGSIEHANGIGANITETNSAFPIRLVTLGATRLRVSQAVLWFNLN